jgi:hypothetical protein
MILTRLVYRCGNDGRNTSAKAGSLDRARRRTEIRRPRRRCNSEKKEHAINLMLQLKEEREEEAKNKKKNIFIGKEIMLKIKFPI